MGEREGGVRMEALEPFRTPGTADAELQRCALVAAGLAPGELTAHSALLLGCALEALRKGGVDRNLGAPALDSSGGLEPGDLRDEVRAGHVVGRRERLVRVV